MEITQLHPMGIVVETNPFWFPYSVGLSPNRVPSLACVVVFAARLENVGEEMFGSMRNIAHNSA